MAHFLRSNTGTEAKNDPLDGQNLGSVYAAPGPVQSPNKCMLYPDQCVQLSNQCMHIPKQCIQF